MILNELDLTYRTVLLDFGTGQSGMRTTYFESINPNARIPALVDHSVAGILDGNGSGIPEGHHPAEPESPKRGGLVVWESGACITYLARKYDKDNRLWAKTIEEQSQIETWV